MNTAQKGFSLIELMASLAIGGSLLWLCLQLFVAFSERLSEAQQGSQLRLEARQILTAMAEDLSTALAVEVEVEADHTRALRLFGWERNVEYRRQGSDHWQRRLSRADELGDWRQFAHGRWQLRVEENGEWFGLELSLDAGPVWRQWVRCRSVNY
ncbi:MAG: prepilin-type N-terminal cleavage/methylation domain-containing protein [Opitutales bacterium]|nr:prepilin-type N-terminal cleavage/methylation domain-containing protein [Opitutales bacterium]